uniref:Sodium channel protein n=1 Tax=Macrostomum lignano TaxID=282301 RepID=A0A1I8G7J9_9PLAT
PQPGVFRQFVPESLAKIRRRQEELSFLGQALGAHHASAFPNSATPLAAAEAGNATAGLGPQQQHQQHPHQPGSSEERRPNAKLEAGMKLPPSMSDIFPVKKLSGIPLEDIDEFYADKMTFVVIAKDKTIFRFSATNALFVLSPFNPVRRGAIFVLTHPAFSLLVLLAIICNCVFMARNSSSEIVEYTFTAIYTTEATIKAVSRGLILSEFTYLRDAWNWLDFIVIGLAYLMFFIPTLGNLSALRSLRVLRALKTVTTVPGLKTIVGALMEAVKRLRDVGILTIFVLSIFALIGLQMYKGTLLQKCVLEFNFTAALEARGYNESVMDAGTLEQIKEQELDLHGNNRSNWHPDMLICSYSSLGQPCPQGYQCFTTDEANPNFGYTKFDNFGWAMLCAFRLMTQDYWENLYQIVIRANGTPHFFFFVLVIMLGSFFLMNVILAIVAMAYDEVRMQDILDEEAEVAARKEEDERREAEADAEAEAAAEPMLQSPTSLSLGNLQEAGAASSCSHCAPQEAVFPFVDDSNAQTPDAAATAAALMSPMRTPLARRAAEKLLKYDIICNAPSTEKEKVYDDRDNVITADDKNADCDKCRCHHADSMPEDIEAVAVAAAHEDAPKEKKFQYWKRVMLEKLCYSWECCYCWKVVEKYVNLFILDPFVELFITICILVNTLFMALDVPANSQSFKEFLSHANLFFTATFAIEAFSKLIGMRPAVYFLDGWNIFDFSIVLLSLVELPLQNVQGLSILRAFRLLRVFKLAKSWQTMNLLFAIIARTMGALGNLVFVLGIVIFIFAVVGMQLFGESYNAYKNVTLYPEYNGYYPRWNFVDFTHSFMIVFRVLCGEWIESMWDCMRLNGFVCVPFFLLTQVIAGLVVLSLFLALLLSSFGSESLQRREEEEEEVNKLQQAIDRINRFIVWSKLKLKSLGSRLFGGLKRRLWARPVPDSDLFEEENGVDGEEGKADNGKGHRGCMGGSNPELSLGSGQSPLTRHGALVIENFGLSGVNHLLLGERSQPATDDPKAAVQITPPPPPEIPDFYKEPEVTEVEVLYWDTPEDCLPAKLAKLFAPCAARLCDSTAFGRFWWGLRCRAYRLVEHRYFETFIIALIAISSLTLTLEDVNLPRRPKLKLTLEYMDKCFTIIFAFEMLVKWFAFGMKKYFSDAWCWLDFVIVNVAVISLVLNSLGGEAGQSMGAFKAMRTLRALRPLRAVSRWEGMRVVVNALIQAIPSIFNVLLVCLVFWLIFSIMGVQLFGGQFFKCISKETGERLLPEVVPDVESCERMRQAFDNVSWVNSRINFDNVLNGYLALFQISTYKGWTLVIADAVDTTGVGKQPARDANTPMYFFFVLFIIFGSFFTLNLFIGVIIDNFNMQKKRAGGSLEMFMTDDQKKYYKAMKKMSSVSPQKPIPKPKLKISKFFFVITSNQKFDIVIMSFIMLNTVVMCVEHHNQSASFSNAVNQVNRFFIVLFTGEAVFKLLAQRWHYFKFAWNVFDFIIVVLSVLTWAMEDIMYVLPVPPTMIRVVRVFRVGRVLRLVKSARGIRTLLFSLFVSLPALFNIGILLLMVMFIYSIVGLSFFSHVRHHNGIDQIFNFETFPSAMIVLFQMSTSAGWDGVLDGLMNEEPPMCNPNKKPHSDCGNYAIAVVFLISYLVISFLVIINMYIAVILENFSQATEDVQEGLTQEDFDLFYEKWEKYDLKARGFIQLRDVYILLDELDPPLQIPAPNKIKLASLCVPICEGDTVYCVDLLDALTKNFLGTGDEAEEALSEMRPAGKAKSERVVITNTAELQRQVAAARVILRYWRHWRREKIEIEEKD